LDRNSELKTTKKASTLKEGAEVVKATKSKKKPGKAAYQSPKKV
jgi:hypothetical protein